MALRLQFLTLVIPRLRIANLADPPIAESALHPEGGILFDTAWYDAHLFADTAMNDGDMDALLDAWHECGLRAPETGVGGRFLFRDYCLATSRNGPLGDCPWLAWDAETRSVWLAGTEPGAVVGGHEELEARQAALADWEARAEAAYAAMYDSRYPRDDYEDACLFLARAQEEAEFLHRTETVDRLKAREAHIMAVYNHQFRR